jgi:hypothetical protein
VLPTTFWLCAVVLMPITAPVDEAFVFDTFRTTLPATVFPAKVSSEKLTRSAVVAPVPELTRLAKTLFVTVLREPGVVPSAERQHSSAVAPPPDRVMFEKSLPSLTSVTVAGEMPKLS